MDDHADETSTRCEPDGGVPAIQAAAAPAPATMPHVADGPLLLMRPAPVVEPDEPTPWSSGRMTIDQKISLELDNIEQKLRLHLQSRSDAIVEEIARRWPQMNIATGRADRETGPVSHPLIGPTVVPPSDDTESLTAETSSEDSGSDAASPTAESEPTPAAPQPMPRRFASLISPLRSYFREPHRLSDIAASARLWAADRTSSPACERPPLTAEPTQPF